MPNQTKSQDQFILSIDEGTTSARALLIDQESFIRGKGQYEFSQIYPRPGWVEQDPFEIWESQKRAFKDALREAGAKPSQVAAIGITNQRETTIIWDKSSGKPVYNAIVWQCRRTADFVERLKLEYGEMFKSKTGLIPDSYFSGPKIKWLLDNIPRLKEKALKGEVAFGTVDSFLIFTLTGGRAHVIDHTNASRTMLFNIHKLEWDNELLEALDIPEQILPEPRTSSEIYGYTDPKVFGDKVPIAGAIGDQQAALFGQGAYEPGIAKCTYGTGNFLLMNTGRIPCYSESLLTTIAWNIGGEVTYSLEGSVFITGAAIQWLKDSLKIINSPSDAETLAKSLESNEGVYFVPALVGLGAPYWDQYARGIIVGLTRNTGQAHLARAALEAIAYLTKDVMDVMEKDSGKNIKELRVDGGATKNRFLMQFQADLLRKKILKPSIIEITSLGAAFMAGLAVDYWANLDELKSLQKIERKYKPCMDEKKAERLYHLWKDAIERSKGWASQLS